VNTHEAKTNLSRLLACVEQGEEIVIALLGKPIARLVPAEERRELRLGRFEGQGVLPEGWDAPLTDVEIAEMFGDDFVPLARS